MGTKNITARNVALEPEPGLLHLGETIAGTMGLARALEILSDYHIASAANQSALEANEEAPVQAIWKIDFACRFCLDGLRQAGWTAESNNSLFFILWPEHPSHPALLKVLEMPRGPELRAHIEAGYIACFGYNHKNAVPIPDPAN